MSEIVSVGTREQILEVVQLAREIWTDHYVPIIGQAQVAYMLERFQSKEAIAAQIADGYEYYIVSRDNSNVGYLGIVPDAESNRLVISKIYVRRAERGKGYGRSMLELADAVCRERGFASLWLTVNRNNADSISWYMRMGFTNVGSIVQDIGGGFVMDDYGLEKTVSS